jgi:hypothetical protein
MSILRKSVVASQMGAQAILVVSTDNFIQLGQHADRILFRPEDAEELSEQIMLAAAEIIRVKHDSHFPHDRDYSHDPAFAPADASRQSSNPTSPVTGDAGSHQEST